ncbi:archaellin/type IV pilin N-terminal domain-containing protein [Candidatus Hodarchaeum mangrovi]
MPRIIRKRRAVSPIIAAILLIGLAVAAGAVLFVVVLPMISAPGGSLVFDESTTLSATGAHIALRNDGVKDASVTNITISNGGVYANFTFIGFNVIGGGAQIKDYTFAEALTAGNWVITVKFSVEGEVQEDLVLPLTVS